MASPMRKLRVLELYSGIGGMHWALKESGISCEVVEAVDINPTANAIYRHNFPKCNLIERQIQNLSVEHLDKLQLDMILMSPPCQPFTRFGNKKDIDDDRTTSFLHILKTLPSLKNKPKYILLENVKGFEVSQCRELLLSTLAQMKYSFQEFLISPLQLGIPNSRLRYYIIAKLRPLQFDFENTNEILENLPPLAEQWLIHKVRNNTQCLTCNNEKEVLNACNSVKNNESVDIAEQPATESFATDRNVNVLPNSKCEQCESYTDVMEIGQNLRQCETGRSQNNCVCEKLVGYLEHDLSEDTLKQFIVSEKEFRWFCVMEIVSPSVRKTSCFTKRYGHFVNGAGSVLFTSNNIEDLCAASKLKENAELMKNREHWGDEEIQIIKNLNLRYFTPREIANLLCFPDEFSFPASVSNIQLYRALGNSLNVHVVSILLKLLTNGDDLQWNLS